METDFFAIVPGSLARFLRFRQRHNRYHVCLYVLLLLIIQINFACAALRTERPKPEQTPPVDEESGVTTISTAIRQFNEFLRTLSFAEANGFLVQAEQAISRADGLTRSHPDFEDLVETVLQARKKLEKVIEEERIAKRERTIDEVIQRSDAILVQLPQLVERVRSRTPTRDDLNLVDKAIEALGTIQREHQEIVLEARYQTYAQWRNQKVDEFLAKRRAIAWQVDAGEQLNTHIQAVLDAVALARNAENPESQLNAYRRALMAATSCTNLATDLMTDPEYKKKVLLITVLGEQNVLTIKKQCTNDREKLQNLLKKMVP